MRPKRGVISDEAMSDEQAREFVRCARVILMPTDTSTPDGRALLTDRRAVVTLAREMEAAGAPPVEVAAAVRALVVELGRLERVEEFVNRPR